MSLGTIISLCDLTGNMVKPWAEAGYECWCVDVQHSIRKDRTENVGRGVIHYVWGDVRTYRRPTKTIPSFVIVQTPCTHTAVSGARDFEKKGGMMLRDALEMFEAGRQIADWSGAPWCQEQPVTMLSSVPHIGTPGHYFDPYQYSEYAPEDYYTKKTSIWGGNGFVMPEYAYDKERYQRGLAQMAEKKRLKDPKYPTPDYPDNRIHFASPTDDRADVRSAAAMGWSRAVFRANAPGYVIAAFDRQFAEAAE